MPKIQSFVSNEIKQKIAARIERKINEGATKYEANESSETAKLIELGLRVQELQESRVEETFNEMGYYKTMLEQMAKTNFTTQKLLGMISYMTEIQGMDKFKFNIMAADILENANEVVAHHFPLDEGDD